MKKFDLTILYVEDDEDIREELEFFLSIRCKELIVAENGKEGLEKYRQFRPDIIITDVMMPVMDGLTMVKILKDEFGEIPIIVMSAFNTSDIKMQNLKALNVKTIVSKPVKSNEIIEAIEKELKLESELPHG